MIKNVIFDKKKGAIYRIIDSQAVILTPNDSCIHTLNSVGTLVWELVDGKNTIEDIAKKVCEEFNVEDREAERDVTRFVEDLIRRKLISPNKK